MIEKIKIGYSPISYNCFLYKSLSNVIMKKYSKISIFMREFVINGQKIQTSTLVLEYKRC